MEKMLIQLVILVGIDCISMVVCGWKRIKVKNDNEKKVLRNLHGEGNFSNIIVFKLGSDIDSAGVLGYWVNGRTTESMIEPHDWTGLNRITRLDDSVLKLYFYKYWTRLYRIELMTRTLKN